MSRPVVQSYLNKARTDKFLLVFDLPPILKQIKSEYTRNSQKVSPDYVQFTIFGTIVPGVTVKGTTARFAGDTLYVSTHSKDPYPPVNVKFAVDSGYNNYWVIYQWLNLLHDQKTGRYNEIGLPIDGNFSDYQTDLTMYALDENDEKVMEFKYTKAFVTSIDPLEYDKKQTGDMELQSGFTFLFSQMHIQPIGGDRFNATLV
jgi:hypothetical protein